MNLVFVLEMLFSGVSVIKNLPANAGDGGSNPQLESSLGVGNCNPFQYSCLGNPTDSLAVHGVTKSQT